MAPWLSGEEMESHNYTLHGYYGLRSNTTISFILNTFISGIAR